MKLMKSMKLVKLIKLTHLSISRLVVCLILATCASSVSYADQPIQWKTNKTLNGADLIVQYKISDTAIDSNKSLFLDIQLKLKPGAVLTEAPDFEALSDWLCLYKTRLKREITKSGQREIHQRFELAPLKLGDSALPQFIWRYKTANSERIYKLIAETHKIRVRSINAASVSTQKILPPRSVIDADIADNSSFSAWAIAIIIGVLATAASAKYWASLHGAEQRSEGPKILSQKEILSRFDQFQSDHSNDNKAYTRILGFVRDGLKSSFKVDSRALTPKQLLERTKSLNLPQEHREFLTAFLSNCDEMRFSGIVISEADISDLIAKTRGFLEVCSQNSETGGRNV